jgi:hypothetical protein
MDIFRIIVCVALFASQSLAQTGGVDGIVASAGTEKADIEQVNAKKGCRSFEEMDAVGKSWLNFDCSKSSNNKVKKIRNGDDVCWLGGDNKMRVRYMWKAFDGPPTNGFRTDCSGFVSGMADVGKRFGGFNTAALGDKCLVYKVEKEEMKPGDILLNMRGYCKDKIVNNTNAKTFGGHVTMFTKWFNDDKTAYYGYEESASKGAVHRYITYPYWRNHSPQCYHAYRFYKSCDATKSPPPHCS